MSDTCFKCHGPGTQEADLRLDERELALQLTASEVAPIVPGLPDESEIIRRIFSSDEAEMMPPPDSHRVLSAEQKTLIRTWVEEGAVYERHWAFEPPVLNPVPSVAGPVAIHTPIDAFLAERLAQRQLTMRPAADRETLVRRVAFALTGLPPTLAEVAAFLGDTTPTAYENMVERYLASPRFGEEMARHWLDVARYADTHGLHLDNERQMWAYRDWVIQSFNDNKPFNQFTIEQVAGDLLPNPTLDQLVGTGFIRCNVTTGEGGSINEEWIYRNALDRTTTTAEAFMGLTAGCAVCHDHKFDPLSAKEFYSLFAFFHSAADPPLDGNSLLTQPALKLITPEQQQQLADFDTRIAAAQKQLDQQAAELAYMDPASIDPPPPPQTVEQIWFDDQIPTSATVTASPGHPPNLVTADNGQVLSGQKALKRVDQGLAQDVFQNLQDLTIPPDGRLFAHVFIEPENPPRSLMLQYFKGGWNHRAVWGDLDAIDWGQAGTPSRIHVGPLPETSQWVRLEVDAAQLNLAAGDQVTGFALTQFGGSVYWDQVGVSGRSDPAADPRRSLLAWWKQQAGKDTPGAPGELNQVLKAGPEKEPTEELRKKLRDYYLQHVCLDTQPQLQPLAKELAAAQQQRAQFDTSIPSTFIYRDLDKPRDSFVMLRGQYNAPGERVEPDVPSFLPPLQRAETGRPANRLDLARWLVSPEHPLTARVAVNRFWQQFYGTGLVKTGFDFGSQGEVPTHPELLDWLAISFRDGGWNVKELVRLLVTSAAFRQSSAATPELWKLDPENRLYARGPRFRLDAEQIRDNALFASGLMDLTMGGRGTRPYQPPNIWEPVGFVGSNTATYTQDSGPALYRRSIYTFLKRTAPPPFMVNFDAPSREAFCAGRERSNTPLQALQLMNDVQHIEAARALAQRMMTQGGATPQERVAFGYRVLLSRNASPEEIAVLSQMFQKQLDRYRQDPESAGKAIRNGQSPPLAELPAEELAAYTLVANLLLNLDETVTRN